MKDKNLPLDYDNRTLEELTDEANQMIKSLEEKDDLDNSVESYQELLKLNNLIEKNFKKILDLLVKIQIKKLRISLRESEKST